MVLVVHDAELSELLLDDVVGSDGVHVAGQHDEPTLVDQLMDRLQLPPLSFSFWQTPPRAV